MILSLGLWGCAVDDEARCDNDALQCHEDALEVCVDGAWEVQEDCAANDQICHEMGDMSHCMDDGSEMSMTM